MPDFTLRNQVCPTHGCTAGRVVVHSRKSRRFRCTACKKTWVYRTGTFHYRLRASAERVDFAIQKLAEGIPIRVVAVLCRASPSTVHRWKVRYLYSQRNF